MKKYVTFILTITQNVLIGRSKQSIGNATMTTWKGKNVLKSKPLTVENPRTDGQVTQRLKMAQTVAMYRRISSIVQRGFKEQAVGKSEYNAFVTANIMNIVDVILPDTTSYNFNEMIISKGTIAPTPMTAIVTSAGLDTVVFTFPSTAAGAGQSVTDKFYALVIDDSTGDYATSLGVAQRSAGTATISIPLTSADNCHVYTFFAKSDGSKESDSTYDNEVVV